MEVVRRTFADAESQYSDRGFRLAEDHGIPAQGDIIDAEQNDGLAIVALVQAFLEENPFSRVVISKALDIEPPVEPQRSHRKCQGAGGSIRC